MMVPSTDEWPRMEFLAARKAQLQHQMAMDAANGVDAQYLGLDDRVVCDGCGADIAEPTVLLVDYGRRVACRQCYDRWYRQQPLTHRRLQPDGSLGDIVR